MSDPINLLDTASLLKKTEEELQRRESQLSRINQEDYKKNLELLKEKRRLETILYSMGDAVFVLDDGLHFTLFNNTAQKLLGLSEAEVLGRHCDGTVILKSEKGESLLLSNLLKANPTGELLSPTPPNSLENAPSTALTGSAHLNEFYLQTKMGLRVAKIRSTRVQLPYDVKAEYVIIVTDITAEKEVTKLKDEFISIVSHELRTPMTAVKGYLWMLTAGKGGELGEKAKVYLAKAVRATDRMISLIGDILSVSAIEQGHVDLKAEGINLKDLVLEELDEIRIKAEQKGLSLEVLGFETLPPALADRRRVLEILVNLVGNAIKFTGSGSIKILGSLEGKFIKVQVVDGGKGFSPLDKEKLFSKFSRLDNSLVTAAESGGTGLGLYISKILTEKMGGSIGADSEGLGRGATFWFRLPASSESQRGEPTE